MIPLQALWPQSWELSFIPKAKSEGHSCWWAKRKAPPTGSSLKGCEACAGPLPLVPPRAKFTRAKPAVGARCPHLSWTPTPPLPIPLLFMGARGKNPGPHIRIRPVHTTVKLQRLRVSVLSSMTPWWSQSLFQLFSSRRWKHFQGGKSKPPNSHFLCQLHLHVLKLNQTRALKLMWHLCMCLDVFRMFACHQAPPKLMDWAPRIPSKEKEQKSRRVSWTRMQIEPQIESVCPVSSRIQRRAELPWGLWNMLSVPLLGVLLSFWKCVVEDEGEREKSLLKHPPNLGGFQLKRYVRGGMIPSP